MAANDALNPNQPKQRQVCRMTSLVSAHPLVSRRNSPRRDYWQRDSSRLQRLRPPIPQSSREGQTKELTSTAKHLSRSCAKNCRSGLARLERLTVAQRARERWEVHWESRSQRREQPERQEQDEGRGDEEFVAECERSRE